MTGLDVLPPYVLKRNARSRTVRVSVGAGGKVKVSAPRWTTEETIKKFLLDHAVWLWQKVEHFRKFPERNRLSLAQEKKLYISHKARAKIVAEAKVKHWNKQFQFVFSRISIRKSRTRWGSCSSKGTLCFNYKIAFLPEHLADYLVVHELCHLKERNHGKNFWTLVAEAIPQYVSSRKELRDFERLITRADTNILMNTNIPARLKDISRSGGQMDTNKTPAENISYH